MSKDFRGAQLIIQDQTAYAIFLLENSAIQNYLFCKAFISSRFSAVTRATFSCSVTSLTACIKLRLFIREYLHYWQIWHWLIDSDLCRAFDANCAIPRQTVAKW